MGTVSVLVVTATESRDFLSFFSFFCFFSAGFSAVDAIVVSWFGLSDCGGFTEGTSLFGITGLVSDSVGDSILGWETEEFSLGVEGMETGEDGETTGEFAFGSGKSQ